MGSAKDSGDIENFLASHSNEQQRLERAVARLRKLESELAHDGIPEEAKSLFSLAFFGNYSEEEPLVQNTVMVLPDWIHQRHDAYPDWHREYYDDPRLPAGGPYTCETPLGNRVWWSPFDLAWDLVNPCPDKAGGKAVRHLGAAEKLMAFLESNGPRLLKTTCQGCGTPYPPPRPQTAEPDWLPRYACGTMDEIGKMIHISKTSISEKWKDAKTPAGEPVCREWNGRLFWLKDWLKAMTDIQR